VRNGHPLLDGSRTADALLQSDFIEVVEHGALYSELSRTVKRVARVDATRYKTSNVLALPYVVAQSDLAAIVPAWFAEQHAEELALTIVKMPSEMSVANFKLLWHSNRDDDSSHAFMRAMITDTADALNRERCDRDVKTLIAFTGTAAYFSSFLRTSDPPLKADGAASSGVIAKASHRPAASRASNL
jgi:hypothetical protein